MDISAFESAGPSGDVPVTDILRDLQADFGAPVTVVSIGIVHTFRVFLLVIVFFTTVLIYAEMLICTLYFDLHSRLLLLLAAGLRHYLEDPTQPGAVADAGVEPSESAVSQPVVIEDNDEAANTSMGLTETERRVKQQADVRGNPEAQQDFDLRETDAQSQTSGPQELKSQSTQQDASQVNTNGHADGQKLNVRTDHPVQGEANQHPQSSNSHSGLQVSGPSLDIFTQADYDVPTHSYSTGQIQHDTPYARTTSLKERLLEEDKPWLPAASNGQVKSSPQRNVKAAQLPRPSQFQRTPQLQRTSQLQRTPQSQQPFPHLPRSTQPGRQPHQKAFKDLLQSSAQLSDRGPSENAARSSQASLTQKTNAASDTQPTKLPPHVLASMRGLARQAAMKSKKKDLSDPPTLQTDRLRFENSQPSLASAELMQAVKNFTDMKHTSVNMDSARSPSPSKGVEGPHSGHSSELHEHQPWSSDTVNSTIKNNIEENTKHKKNESGRAEDGRAVNAGREPSTTNQYSSNTLSQPLPSLLDQQDVFEPTTPALLPPPGLGSAQLDRLTEFDALIDHSKQSSSSCTSSDANLVVSGSPSPDDSEAVDQTVMNEKQKPANACLVKATTSTESNDDLSTPSIDEGMTENTVPRAEASKKERRLQKAAVRASLEEAWCRREYARAQVLATFAYDRQKDLEEFTQTYMQLRQSLADLMSGGVLSDADAAQYPMFRATELVRPNVKPFGINETKKRIEQEQRSIAKARNVEEPEPTIDVLKARMLASKKLIAHNSEKRKLGRPGNYRKSSGEWRRDMEAARVRGETKYRHTREVLSQEYPGDVLPLELQEEFPEI